MTKQFVAPIILLLTLVAVVACGGVSSSTTPVSQGATPASQDATPEPKDSTTEPSEATPESKDSTTEPSVITTTPSIEEITEIYTSTPFCAIFPTLDGDGQEYGGRGTENGDVLAAKLGLSHGEVVFHTIVDTISATMGQSPDRTDPGLINTPNLYRGAVVILVVDNFKKPSAADAPGFPSMIALYQSVGILIVGVDIGSWEIDQVSRNIIAAIKTFVSDSTNPVKGFVINMSFALIPCNDRLQMMLEQYRKGVNTDFAYLYKGLSEVISTAYGQHLDWLKVPGQDKKFFDFTKCLSAHSDNRICGDSLTVGTVTIPKDTVVILVGAAGNSHYPYPFAPALWGDQVVSTSASDSGNINMKASYSNTGEVMMDGSTRWNDIEIKVDGTTEKKSVVGTSFASPRLAFYEAKYLFSNPNPRCQGSLPPLGYVPEASNAWQDLPLPVARAQYCSSFPP